MAITSKAPSPEIHALLCEAYFKYKLISGLKEIDIQAHLKSAYWTKTQSANPENTEASIVFLGLLNLLTRPDFWEAGLTGDKESVDRTALSHTPRLPDWTISDWSTVAQSNHIDFLHVAECIAKHCRRSIIPVPKKKKASKDLTWLTDSYSAFDPNAKTPWFVGWPKNPETIIKFAEAVLNRFNQEPILNKSHHENRPTAGNRPISALRSYKTWQALDFIRQHRRASIAETINHLQTTLGTYKAEVEWEATVRDARRLAKCLEHFIAESTKSHH